MGLFNFFNKNKEIKSESMQILAEGEEAKKLLDADEVFMIVMPTVTGETIPYLNPRGCPFVFLDQEQAESFINTMPDFIPQLDMIRMSGAQLKERITFNLSLGIGGYFLVGSEDSGTYNRIWLEKSSAKGRETVDEKYYSNATLNSYIIRAAQHPVVCDEDMLGKMIEKVLPSALKTALLLMPMSYEDEVEDDMYDDGILHITTGAEDIISKMNSSTIRFYGGENHRFATEADGRRMSFVFVTNPRTGENALPVFTDIFMLKQIYPNMRIAILSYDDLLKHLDENEQTLSKIIFNPNSMNYMIDKELAMEFKQ